MPRLAVFVKTFLRDEALFQCIASLERFLPRGSYRIYIADDGLATEEKGCLYDRLRRQGHVIVELSYNVGASAARNALLKELREEEYVLRLDDDFVITEETQIADMIKVMDSVRDIGSLADLERQAGHGKGVLSGRIVEGQGRFERRDGVLIKHIQPIDTFTYEEIAGLRVAYCDFTRNMLLLRREVFRSVRWEERLRFEGEHADFMLQLQQAGWRVAFTRDSVHTHDEYRTYTKRAEYARERRLNSEGVPTVLMEKWGVDRIEVRRPLRLLVGAGFAHVMRAVSGNR